MGTSGTEEQKYNLRWQDYPQSVVSSFRNLKEEEDFVDVTLACNSQQFTAHKVVLSACSPYFRKLLKTNPCQHPIVILRDISEADLKSLLKFMYHGEVQISEERLKDFLKTAETLQVRGLAESCATAVTSSATVNGGRGDDMDEGDDEIAVTNRHSSALRRRRIRRRDRDGGDEGTRRLETDDDDDNLAPGKRTTTDQKTMPTSGNDITMDDRDMEVRPNFGISVKRFRTDGDNNTSPRSVSPPTYRDNDTYHHSLIDDRKENNNMSKDSLLSQALEKPLMPAMGNFISNMRTGSDGHDDSGASDTGSERPESMTDIKSDASELHRQLSSPAAMAAAAQAAAAGLFPPGLEALYRQAGFPSAFLSMGHHQPGSGPGGMSLPGMGHPPQQGGLQSHSNNPTIGGKLDMMRIRATDPRPCPKCGKIYRSAHTLRTHMEDKHTVCPGYRCVLCGTVAKSRNSLHSHMSRQHRGISTKDLPVVPMPAPFDAELASRLLAKAGVKVSPNELAARASPTAPRRSDIPKLDSNLLGMQQQFPLPSNIPNSSGTVLMHGRAMNSGGGEAEDLRIPTSSPFGLPHMRGGMNHKDFAAVASAAAGAAAHGGSMGSALLDTYLSMIAAAGENNMAAAAAALNSFPAGRAAAFAAAAQAAAGGRRLDLPGLNGDGKDVDVRSDREDESGELGSDADISDTEDNEPNNDNDDDDEHN